MAKKRKAFTQEDMIIEKLQTDGQVDNFWALSHNILRLAPIMISLEEKGWRFIGVYGTENQGLVHKLKHSLLFGQTGIDTRNYYYIVRKQPNNN